MSKLLKANSSEGRRVIAIYNGLTGTTLSDLYKKPSQSTIATYEKLRSRFDYDEKYQNGHSWKNTKRAGSWSWSCGWKFNNGHECLRVETRDNTYIVDLEA